MVMTKKVKEKFLLLVMEALTILSLLAVGTTLFKSTWTKDKSINHLNKKFFVVKTSVIGEILLAEIMLTNLVLLLLAPVIILYAFGITSAYN